MKQVERYHILASPIGSGVYVGTIKEKSKNEDFVISENKVDRTQEFLQAIITQYKDNAWRIKGEKTMYGCCVLSPELINKHKNKTLGEFFKGIIDFEKEKNEEKK